MTDRKSARQRILELFPNTFNVWIFILYIGFWVGQGVLVALTRGDKEEYDYNTVGAILFSETLKLIISYLCYIRNHSMSSLWYNVKSNTKILGLYLVPSFLYCCYNNLAFVNLSHYDPTTYYILLQLRVVVTGLCFQITFNKKLSRVQWMALFLLTCGCIIQQLNFNRIKSFFFQSPDSPEHSFFTIYLFFIFIQVFCSCVAGVYNEHLLKDIGANVNIFIQNIFMYVDSIFWNLLFLFYQGNLFTIFSKESLQPLTQPLVLVIILTSSFIGITTSLFLKNFNSLIKVFASAIELSLSAVLCWIVLGIEIKQNTILSILVVSCSLYVYFTNLEPEKSKLEVQKQKEDEEALLQEV